MSAAEITSELPIYNPDSAIGRRESHMRSEVKYIRIHLVPLVMMCFFILWCFSSPVELETKDGRTNFVPRTKKQQKKKKQQMVDLTVLALENPSDRYLPISDERNASLALLNHTKLSLFDSHNHNASLTNSHEPNASFSVSHELKAPISVWPNASFLVHHPPTNASFLVYHPPSASFSDSHEPNELFSDSTKANAPMSASHDAKLLFPVSHEPRILYNGTINESALQPSKDG